MMAVTDVPGISSGLRRPLVALLVATALLAIALSLTGGSVAAASNVTVTQTPAEATVSPGENLTFTVNLSTPENFNGPGVDVSLPAGWTLIDQSTSPPGTYSADRNQWVWFSGGDKTVRYTVRVPTNASGSYTIHVEGSGVNPDTDEIETATTESTVTVGATTPPSTPTPTATGSPTPPRSPTPTPTPTPTATQTATPTPTAIATERPTSTPSPTPTDTPSPTSGGSPTPTLGTPSSPTPTATPSRTRRASATPTEGGATDTATGTPTPSLTRSSTPTSAMATATPTATWPPPTSAVATDPTPTLTTTPGDDSSQPAVPGFGIGAALVAILAFGIRRVRSGRD